MKTVTFVPIKLHSQKITNMIFLPIAGRPLCWHLCNTLLKIKSIDEVYVFCSEDNVLNYLPDGIRFLKMDKSFEGDSATELDIYREFIKQVDADLYILAHATSPFIKESSIEDALYHVLSGEYDSAFSAKRVQTFAWFQGMPINYDLNDVPRTQDMEPVWVETSAFVIFLKEVFTIHNRRTGFKPYIREVAGLESIDIDNESDYELACKLSKIERI